MKKKPIGEAENLVLAIIEERDALSDKVAGLQSGIDVALGLLERAITKIGEYKDSAALWETRYNQQTALASEVIRERDEVKSERVRALMALEFCKNRSSSRGGSGGTNEERLSEIFHRASQIIGDDFDSYKTQLDLK